MEKRENRKKTNLVRAFMKKIYRKTLWNRVVTSIACAVVFVTTYMLILPAITLTRNPVCGFEEHTHTDACYTEVYVPVLDCPYGAAYKSDIQTAFSESNTTEDIIILPEQEPAQDPIIIHTHDENCYDAEGNLVCTLPEIEAHVHTEECYAPGSVQEPAEIFSGDAVYENAPEQIINQEQITNEVGYTNETGGEETGGLLGVELFTTEENRTDAANANGSMDAADPVSVFDVFNSEGTTDTTYPTGASDVANMGTVADSISVPDASGTVVIGEPVADANKVQERQLICGKQEIIPHVHTEECYDETGKLICGLPQAIIHQHTQEECFHLESAGKQLTCTLPEHVHTDDCYDKNEEGIEEDEAGISEEEIGFEIFDNEPLVDIQESDELESAEGNGLELADGNKQEPAEGDGLEFIIDDEDTIVIGAENDTNPAEQQVIVEETTETTTEWIVAADVSPEAESREEEQFSQQSMEETEGTSMVQILEKEPDQEESSSPLQSEEIQIEEKQAEEFQSDEQIEETSEEVTEVAIDQIAEETTEVTTEDVSELTTEDAAEVATEVVSEVATEDASEATSEETPVESTEEALEETSVEAIKKVTEETTEITSEEIPEKLSERVSDSTTEVVSEKYSEETTETVQEETSETASEEAAEEESEKVSEKISEGSLKTITEETTEATSEMVSERVSEEASEEFSEETTVQSENETPNETSWKLEYPGEGYTVRMICNAESGVPKDATLLADEILPDQPEYEIYRQQALETLKTGANTELPKDQARFFNILILAPDGSRIDPARKVEIEIICEEPMLDLNADETAPSVISFDENNNGKILETIEKPEVQETEEFENADEGENTENSDGTKEMQDAQKSDDSLFEALPQELPDLNSFKLFSKLTAPRGKSALMAAPAAVVSPVPSMLDTDAEEKTAGTTVSFMADSSNVYGIVGTTIEKIVLASDGHNYRITATYGAETGIPADADLAVEEISADSELYGEYVSKTENALGMEEGSAGYIRLFDISIIGRDDPGIKYQPAAGTAVDIRIELADSISEWLNVVHFADGEEEGKTIDSITENGEACSMVGFQADSFSVYSIVDAPEPAAIISTGWYTANSLDQIEELGENGFYVSYNGYYLTGDLVHNVTNNSDRDGLVATPGQHNSVPEDLAAKFYFSRMEGTDTFKIYVEDENGVKNYVKLTSVSGNSSRAGLTLVSEESDGTAFTIEKNGNSNNFYISAQLPGSNEYWWNSNNKDPGKGAFVGYNLKKDQNTAKVTLSYYYTAENDPYGLDGKTFGIAYNDDSVTAAGVSAAGKTVSGQERLEGVDMLIRSDVLTNSGNLLVAENSDIQAWTFESVIEDKYYIKTTVDGAVKYLSISGSNVTLVDTPADASIIKATPGTGSNSGKWHFTAGGYSLNYAGSAANGFNAANGSGASTWLNLVEKSTLTDEDFVEYSARKISASDDILSATQKDDNGEILKDDEGNVVYKSEKTKVVIYTRVWNETTKKYEFYAVDHDGSLVRVYDSGDRINWVGNKVNSALWEFTEYTNTDGTPNYYYELENTAYSGTYLVPQSEGIISDQTVGINLNGRREGFDYTTIVAWDDNAYAYSGLKIERNADGTLKVVTCPLDDADDFYFAVIAPPVETAGSTSEVTTVDNNEHGISIRMVDFNNTPLLNDRDPVQNPFFGAHPWDQHHPDTGLLSTDLTNGYPVTTAHTGEQGRSLSELFSNMTPANHLFIQSVYNESGYFEYDSTQNFAHLNEDGTFKVYNELGAIGTSTGPTRAHGQFMPYNDISPETGYATDSQGNIITNRYNVRGQELSDTDPRKGEPLYLIPQKDADYFFGMELSASFTQTPDGVDNWGHDIIFEFTGDDDFWLYVDEELVLDLGGIHSALPGSVNFRTGEVNVNGTWTTLKTIFYDNYVSRGHTAAEADEYVNNIFEQKFDDQGNVLRDSQGNEVYTFKDYTNHQMKMFYMERGAGASNLKMRFNLASVKPGTAELTKKLTGTSSSSNKLIQYPYQIWYAKAVYRTNEDGSYALDGNGQRIVDSYTQPVLLEQPSSNANLTGAEYAAYKGTNTLIPYKDSMSIDGQVYNNVFLLRAGETAVLNFPEDTYQYKIVECGVNTQVYEHVFVNGTDITGNGMLYNNTDTGTQAGQGETCLDFGIDYKTTEERPRVEYTNQMAPDVMRTLAFRKQVYGTDDELLTDTEAAAIEETFTFRLYLGNEYTDQNSIPPANMYSYLVKDPAGHYCRWNSGTKAFESLPYTSYEGAGGLEEYLATLGSAEKAAIVFTTSMNGTISNIHAGYTVEVRDLIVGTKYKIEERDGEIPRGYTRRAADGYVRTDLGSEYVYYTENGTYGRYELTDGSTAAAEPISDTIASKTDSPMIDVRNQEGWGLSAKKVWTDKDFVEHDDIFLAVYLKDENGGLVRPVGGTVRRLTNSETEAYWFFPDLRDEYDSTVIHSFDEYIVREVTLTGSYTVDADTGAVEGFETITPVSGNTVIGCTPIGGEHRYESYSVSYDIGSFNGRNSNIRMDTITNARPGIDIYKINWDGTEHLSGAVFTLKDSAGNNVAAASYTSGSEGLVTTAYLSPGVYTLDEIKTPTGYTALDEPITITVTTTEPENYDLTVPVGDITYFIALSGPEGFYSAAPATAENMARITVKNRTVQELKVEKVGDDGSTRTPLSGVHFALYDQVLDSDGNLRPAYNPKIGYEDLETNEEGILETVTMSLGAGTYYLREKAAPSGYKKLAGDLCFKIGGDGTVQILNSEYSDWLTKDTSVPGAVSYKISIVNTPVGITIRKTDEAGNKLLGSSFLLRRKNDQGIYVNVTEYGLGEGGQIDLTDNAEITITGMSSGTYQLTETNAPAGYIILTKEIYFSVADGAVKLTDKDGNPQTYSGVSLLDDNTTIAVKNTPGVPLPYTGGPGTTALYLLGIMLTGIAGAGLVMRKRRRI